MMIGCVVLVPPPSVSLRMNTLGNVNWPPLGSAFLKFKTNYKKDFWILKCSNESGVMFWDTLLVVITTHFEFEHHPWWWGTWWTLQQTNENTNVNVNMLWERGWCFAQNQGRRVSYHWPSISLYLASSGGYVLISRKRFWLSLSLSTTAPKRFHYSSSSQNLKRLYSLESSRVSSFLRARDVTNQATKQQQQQQQQ